MQARVLAWTDPSTARTAIVRACAPGVTPVWLRWWRTIQASRAAGREMRMIGPAGPWGLVVVALFAAAPLWVTSALAQPTAGTSAGSAAEQQLIQKVRQQIMKELLEGDFLKQQIDLGIQRHIKLQEQARIDALSAKERLANENAKNVRRVSSDRDHIYGNPQAAISIVEYSDFECPYCKRFHPTPKQLVEAYQGKVNWVYRHFPLAFHNPGAQKQAEASECAHALGGNGAFWKYTDAIYTRTTSNGKGFPLDKLTPLAAEIGLDGEQFRSCLDSGKFAARVQEDIAEGAKIGINGTPASILLNNQTGETRLATGAQPLALFKAHIDKMLE